MLSLFEKLDGEKQAEVGYKHPIYKVYVKTSFLYFFYFFFGWGEGGGGGCLLEILAICKFLIQNLNKTQKLIHFL